MKSWIHAIVTHQGNDTLVDIWNVVNEPIMWDGKGSYWPINASDFENANEFHRLGFEPDANGFLSKALRISGDKENVSSPVFAEGFENDFSFTCFMKTDSNQPGVVATFSGSEDSMLLSMNNDGFIVFLVDGQELKSIVPLNDNEWHFIAIQREADNYRLFIDGTDPVDSLTHDILPFNQFIVGTNSDGLTSFNGLWAEVGRANANVQTYLDDVTLYSTTYTYRIRAFNKFGVSGPSVSQSVTTPGNPVNTREAIDGSGQNQIEVFPNPGSDHIRLNINSVSHVQIFDLAGKLLWEKEDYRPEDAINVSGFQKGVYLIKVFNDEVGMAKWVKR